LTDDEVVRVRQCIGERARDARAALRMTQTEVAEAIGLAPEVYGRLERGLMMPSVPTLVSIAQVLRVSPDQLLGWTTVASTDRSAEFQRVMGLLERANEAELKRALAVVEALLGGQ
jgi:transcriptional regulator with XRE-family HTH domain